jgi:spore maturation protein CgeB
MTSVSTVGLSLVPSRKGALSLRVTGPDGAARALHSLYDPEQEACSLVERWSYEGRGRVVVLGVGLGYHVLELARRFPDAQFVVVEASEEIYALARQSGNLEALSGRATFVVGLPPAEALREITRIQLACGMRPLSFFPLPAAISAFGEYYEPILTALTKAVHIRLWDRLRYRKFERETVRVLLIDFDYFLTREVEAAARALGHEVARVRIRKGENGEAIVARLIERILSFRPDFLFTLNHLGFDQDGVLTGFLASIEMPVACWYVDSPNLIVKEFKANVSPTTTVFLWDKDYLQEMKALGFEGACYLPLATDERTFRPLRNPRGRGGVSACEVGFVGNSMVEPVRERMARIPPDLHPLVEELAGLSMHSRKAFHDLLARLGESAGRRVDGLGAAARVDLEAAVLWRATLLYRLRCVEKLLAFGARIHGDDGWKELLDRPDALRPPLAYYDELPRFYNLCKINFNATNLQMGAAVNQRVFDVPACGAFLLTDRQEALDELFDVGREMIAFRDPDEIPELAGYYLRHPEARRQVAATGRNRVLSEHTYRHRFKRIVQIMKANHGAARMGLAVQAARRAGQTVP